jgi:tetratricopeptide (TPR) repeat protein
MIHGRNQARADHLTRFRIEAEAVARLRHPNILQIYDIGEAGGLPFVTLELLEGGSLHDRLAGDPQPGRSAAELVMTLARAVEVAHQAGIVHRDLKPSNVLYTSDNVPKIADFGLAKRIDSDPDGGQTETGHIMGSPSYMAPEQARGHSRDVGPAADIYALGAILYHSLTGRPPFKGETPMETVRQVTDDDPVAPSRLVPRLPRDLETICLKCLHKEPRGRYGSAQELADDLARFLRAEPIRARRTPGRERILKWARRQPVAALLVVLSIALFLATALCGFSYLSYKSEWSLQQQFLGSRLIDQAMEARTRDGLTRAELALSHFREKIRGEPRLADLLGRIDQTTIRMQDRLAQLKEAEDERSRDQHERLRVQAERERFRRFGEVRTIVLFHDTQFTGLGLADNREAIRRGSLAALALFAAPTADHSWALGALPSSLSRHEQAEIAEGCYELLLILATAEASPHEGLRRLDQATRLRPPTAAYHLRRAACLSAAGLQAAALEERRRAQALQPATAFDHFLIGREDYRQGDVRRALEHFNRALHLQPDHFWAHCLSALCLLQSREPIQARSRLNACLQEKRDFPWLYLLRGFASSQVAAALKDLAARSPGRGERYHDQAGLQLDEAEADYAKAQELLAWRPSDELQYALLVNRGVLALERGDFDKAAGLLEAAIRRDGRQFPAYVALAHVYTKQSKLEAAFGELSRAIALRPNLASLYRDRAQVHLARDRPSPAHRAAALSDLAQAIQLEPPGNPVLARDHTKRARVLIALHREIEALAACDAALKIVPNDETALRLRIDLLLAAKRYSEVVRLCEALMAGGKVPARVAELRGLAKAGLKDYVGAIEDATLALSVSPEQAHLLAWRGWLYILADAPRLALRDFEAAIWLDSSRGEAYMGRGAARARLGRHAEAVADAETGLNLGPCGPRLSYNAARIYAIAAAVAGNEARKHGQDAALLAARYQERALALLRQALKSTPAEKRASFWRDSVEADPVLRPLIRRVNAADVIRFAAEPAH